MVEVFKKEYWSKSNAFLLPLTGLPKALEYKLESYLFWENFSVEDYYIILVFNYDNYDDFLEYCKKNIFPILDRNTCLIESHDYDNQTVFVVDISEWAMDVEKFLKGRYSKFSPPAKDIITDYHIYYDKGNKIDIKIQASLEPNEKYSILGDMTAIEYVSENYEIPYDELKKIGELGGIYSKEKETLTGLKEEHDHYLRKEGNPSG